MHGTEHFQKQTADALCNANAPCPRQVVQQNGDSQSRRFNIYRNNRTISLIENLQACYPAVYKLLGDEFFNASARHYINQQPPTNPVMTEYGESFGVFIGLLPSTAKIPYITDIAKLEWGRLQAYHQVDAEPIVIETLSHFAPEELAHLRLCAHPTLTVIESHWPIGSIWAATVYQQPTPADFDVTKAECVLILRPHLEVSVNLIDKSTVLFLDTLLQGESIENSAECALKHDPNFNPGIQLQRLFGLGAFSNYAV